MDFAAKCDELLPVFSTFQQMRNRAEFVDGMLLTRIGFLKMVCVLAAMSICRCVPGSE